MVRSERVAIGSQGGERAARADGSPRDEEETRRRIIFYTEERKGIIRTREHTIKISPYRCGVAIIVLFGC